MVTNQKYVWEISDAGSFAIGGIIKYARKHSQVSLVACEFIQIITCNYLKI